MYRLMNVNVFRVSCCILDFIHDSEFWAEKDTAKFVTQILAALRYLHERRDCVKMMDHHCCYVEVENGEPIVKVDLFEISARAWGFTYDRMSGDSVPYYVSPACLTGETYDEKEDLWALSALTFVMYVLISL